MSIESVIERMRGGSDFDLYYGDANGSVSCARVHLFLSNGNPATYGRSGCLFWSSPGSHTESSQRRFPLHTIIDMRLRKQTSILKSAAANAAPDDRCFSLRSSTAELNLAADTHAEREDWWRGILWCLETAGRQLMMAAKNGSSISEPISGGQSAIGTDPLRQLIEGQYFKRYWIDSKSGPQSADVFVWCFGSGRQGSLAWCFASPPPGPNPSPPSSQQRVVRKDCTLALSTITDIVLKKKASAAFKQCPSPDDCCFAIVCSTGDSLNLAAPSREISKSWQDAILIQLTTSGKQLIKRTSMIAQVGPASSTPPMSHSNSGNMIGLSDAQASESDAVLLTGQSFTSYNFRPNSNSSVDSQIYSSSLVECPNADGNPGPGKLCWCSASALSILQRKEQVPGQELHLSQMQTMSAGKETMVLKAALSAKNDCCLSISANNGVQLHLEAKEQATRELWLRALHSRLIRAGKKAQTAVAGGMQQSNSQKLLSASGSNAEQEKLVLKEGACFQMYTQNMEILPVFVWFGEATAADSSSSSVGPGIVYFQRSNVLLPESKRQAIEGQFFNLSWVSQMCAGKETAVFKSPFASQAVNDKCLSLVSLSKGVSLNLEATSQDVRELWLKSLHSG